MTNGLSGLVLLALVAALLTLAGSLRYPIHGAGRIMGVPLSAVCVTACLAPMGRWPSTPGATADWSSPRPVPATRRSA